MIGVRIRVCCIVIVVVIVVIAGGKGVEEFCRPFETPSDLVRCDRGGRAIPLGGEVEASVVAGDDGLLELGL